MTSLTLVRATDVPRIVDLRTKAVKNQPSLLLLNYFIMQVHVS